MAADYPEDKGSACSVLKTQHAPCVNLKALKIKLLSGVTILAAVLLPIFMTGCHPEGLYGPNAFGYNTQGVTNSNLFGTYSFDGTNAQVLSAQGFTNLSGFIELKPNMTFVFSNVPSVMAYPKTNLYYSTTGNWRVVQEKAIWVLEVYNIPFGTMSGYVGFTFPILGETSPHGIELTISHDEGYWIRFSKSQTNNQAK